MFIYAQVRRKLKTHRAVRRNLREKFTRSIRYRAFLCRRQVGSGKLKRLERGSEDILPPGNVETHFRWLNNISPCSRVISCWTDTISRARSIVNSRYSREGMPFAGKKCLVDAIKLIHKKFIISSYDLDLKSRFYSWLYKKH